MPFYIKQLLNSDKSVDTKVDMSKPISFNQQKDKFIFNNSEEFVKTIAPIYIQKLNKYGIDLNYAPQLIAQACLESGWGQKPIG